MSVEFKSTSFRPSAGTKTGKVWELADRLSKKTGRKAKRKAVIEAYTKEGGNRNTAAKQFDDWQQEYEEGQFGPRSSEPVKPASVERRKLEVGTDGRLLIPAEFRDAMQVSPGDTISAWVEEGELHVVSRSVGLQKMQNIVRKHVPEGVSLVDEFIKDKRAEEAKEKRDWKNN